MPELPEVEIVRRTLSKNTEKQTISKVSLNYTKIVKTNLEKFKTDLIGQTIESVDRKAKYLIFNLTDYVLVSHLRMFGKYFFNPDSKNFIEDKHDLIFFYFKDGGILTYNDGMKYGTMHLYPKSEFSYDLLRLGDEPYTIKAEDLHAKLLKKNVAIKSVLLDQSIMSGLGNIYVDEVLFACKIHPEQKAKTINIEQTRNIISNSIRIFDLSLSLGGSSIHTFSDGGSKGSFQDKLLVHQRAKKPCPNCGTIITKSRVGGRGTFTCQNCQKIK